MGSCLCKQSSTTMAENRSSEPKRPRLMEVDSIEFLILSMLRCIGTFPDGEEAPAPLIKICQMADSDEGWCNVIMALVQTVPLFDPLGPSVITIVFDDCPLPSQDTLLTFTASLNLCRERCAEAYRDEELVRQERNVLVMLGCIAEKFAGPNSTRVLTINVLRYLITFLKNEIEPRLVLHALIALEKFARTTKNKLIIEKYISAMLLHPLLPLELYSASKTCTWREVGFCARWALDNIFVFPGRQFSFETEDMRGVHVMLNTHDVSEYLKISPDGLEARCDSHSFESVRGTFQIDSGCWYYEATVVTAGVMQIGWATKNSAFQNHEGYGVGDDCFSLAYDGCRRLVWYKAEATEIDEVPSWEPGDVLGCLIDIDSREAVFSLNGKSFPVCTEIFSQSRSKLSSEPCSEGFYAAASFMAHQQCQFNFGASKFEHPPQDRPFRVMNEIGVLKDEEKKVIPRRVLLENIPLEENISEKLCVICLDRVGSYGIDPCKHGNFCLKCIKMMETCPLCRCQMEEFHILAL